MAASTKGSSAPSPFSETVSNLQLAWDSTSLKDFVTCPRLYQYHIIEGWCQKKRPPTLHFGIGFHSAAQAYEMAKAKEPGDRNAAVRAGVRAADRSWGDYGESDDNRRTRFTLIRAIIWYADHYANDAAKTVILKNGKAAVELSFRSILDFVATTGEHYVACGHLDRLAKLGDDYRVVDAKTTVATLADRYFSMYDLDLQMDLYDFFGRVVLTEKIVGLMIDGVQTAVNFTRFGRAFSDRKPGNREEWYNELGYWIRQAEDCAINNYWPMNKTSCSKWGGCRFRDICKREPSVRKMLLQSDFKIDHWNPLESREGS